MVVDDIREAFGGDNGGNAMARKAMVKKIRNDNC
jgi:hypothetical protein